MKCLAQEPQLLRDRDGILNQIELAPQFMYALPNIQHRKCYIKLLRHCSCSTHASSLEGVSKHNYAATGTNRNSKSCPPNLVFFLQIMYLLIKLQIMYLLIKLIHSKMLYLHLSFGNINLKRRQGLREKQSTCLAF